MTAQAHERLIDEGDALTMAFCPEIPIDHPNITLLSKEEIAEGMASGEIDRFIYSTACWRQYIGTWAIERGRFYLVSVNGIFRVEDGPIFADWFTGILRVPRGERLHYVHMGFGSIYEEEVHIRIVGGFVTNRKVIDNRDKPLDDNLGWLNLPGGENNFDGDDDWD